MRNPKRDRSSYSGRASWFPYYAGYSPSFVSDIIENALGDRAVKRILDPWNGSGTTTQKAFELGAEADGFDVNPVMVMVAKARTLHGNVAASLSSLTDEILGKAARLSPRYNYAVEPLESWFTAATAATLREIEFSIHSVLIDPNRYEPLAGLKSFEHVSSLSAFFYVALFRCVQKLVKPFRSSNPTWIRSSNSGTKRVFVNCSRIAQLFREEVIYMKRAMEAEQTNVAGVSPPRVLLADSKALPVPSGMYDFVLSSPPYCTRIDYAVKTRTELSVLGADHVSIRALRDAMVGTPTIASTPPVVENDWGRTCVDVLSKIERHTAKASKSYYWKTFIQYFSGLYRSLFEINRVTTESALCTLVVQDSYYKDVRVALGDIVNEMMESLNWRPRSRTDFHATRTMAGLNTVSKRYHSSKQPIESVLVWEKGLLG